MFSITIFRCHFSFLTTPFNLYFSFEISVALFVPFFPRSMLFSYPHLLPSFHFMLPHLSLPFHPHSTFLSFSPVLDSILLLFPQFILLQLLFISLEAITSCPLQPHTFSHSFKYVSVIALTYFSFY